MSTPGWIALVLVALAVALVLWMKARPARGLGADSPRTVADLVRLRAERAEAVEPEPAPTEAVVVPEPRVVTEQAPVVAEPLDEVPPAEEEERQTAPVRVSASADDTPWNRAARIAENAGIVWATDHRRAAVAEDVVTPEPVLRPVRLPAFPPDLVATRSTVQPAGYDPAVVADPAAVGQVPPAPVSAEPADLGSAAAESESAVAEPAVAEPAAGGSASDGSDAVEPAVASAGSAASEPAVPEAAVAESGVAESGMAEPAVAAAPTVEAERPVAEPARPRRSPAETAAEQAAADLALLRTFGCADPADDDPSTVSLEGACCVAAAPEVVPGAAQTVAFHVVGRDGTGVPGAGVTLLDDRGGEAAGAVTDGDGRGTVQAPQPGSYVLVSAANGHQPGAVAITVAGGPVSADLLLARSASLSGVVHGEDGPVVGARLTLVQDGEIVDTAMSGSGGAYRIADLAAGEYGLSVTAAECEPAAVLVTVPDETDFRHDVELDPVGLNRPVDDVMIGLS